MLCVVVEDVEYFVVCVGCWIDEEEGVVVVLG